MVADGEEVVDSDDKEDEGGVAFTSEHKVATVAGEASEVPKFDIGGEGRGEYFVGLFSSIDVACEYTNMSGVFV